MKGSGRGGSARGARRWLVLVGAALLAGCAPYRPAPLQPAAFPAAFDARRMPPSHTGAWTGAELLAVALDNNPSVAEAEGRYRVAVRAVRVARNPPNMVLTLTAEYAEQSPHWGPAAAIDLPIDRGGRRSGRITQAELQALQAFYDWQEAAWAVRTALARARAELAGADMEIALADAAVAIRREREERMRRRVEAGEDERLQQLTLSSDLIAAQRRADDARGRRGAALVALGTALGLPVGAVVDATIAPPVEPGSLTELPRWRTEAAVGRRDVLRALVDYDLAENALRFEVARQYPDVRVQPGVFWDHGVLKVPLTAALTLPPRDGNRAAIAQAEAARSAAAKSVDVLQARALQTADASAGGLQIATAVRDRMVERDVPASQRLVADAEHKVRAGEGDRLEHLSAQASFADARAALADAERARRTALVNLEDALRRPFDSAEAALLDGRLREASAQ